MLIIIIRPTRLWRRCIHYPLPPTVNSLYCAACDLPRIYNVRQIAPAAVEREKHTYTLFIGDNGLDEKLNKIVPTVLFSYDCRAVVDKKYDSAAVCCRDKTNLK